MELIRSMPDEVMHAENPGRLAAWLDEHENRHRFVLAATDPGESDRRGFGSAAAGAGFVDIGLTHFTR